MFLLLRFRIHEPVLHMYEISSLYVFPLFFHEIFPIIIRIVVTNSERVAIQRGIRQVSVLSPMPFNLYSEMNGFQEGII